MTVLVIYNIKETRKKRIVRKMLLNYGEPLKPSVFKCSLNLRYYKRLKTALTYAANNIGKEEFITIFTLCKNCRKNMVSLGKPLNTEEPLYFLA